MKTRVLYCMLLTFLFYESAYSDALIFKNGRRIDGIIRKETGQEIALDVNGGTVKFQRSLIQEVIRSSPEEQSSLKAKWTQERAARIAEAQEFTHPPRHVSINQESGAIIVEALLNKKVKSRLVLDTGASLIVLSNEIAKKLGIDLDKEDIIDVVLADGTKASAVRTVLDSVSVQDAQIDDVEAAVIVNTAEKASTAWDGLLGMSFLDRFNFRIDTDNGKLILEEK